MTKMSPIALRTLVGQCLGEVALQKIADRQPAPAIAIRTQVVCGLSVLKCAGAVAARGSMRGLGESRATCFFERDEQRQISPAASAGRFLRVFRPANRTSH